MAVAAATVVGSFLLGAGWVGTGEGRGGLGTAGSG